jgi:CRP/FNR family transcriptional regulator, anaerobic regulatory protein
MTAAVLDERTIERRPSTRRPRHVTVKLAGAASRHSSCSSCYLQKTCLPEGLTIDQLGEMDELTRLKRKVSRDTTLYRKGDIFSTIYAVRSGAFKTVNTSHSRPEKVIGLHLPGDLLGLEAICGHVHTYNAVALEDSEVCAIPYEELQQLLMRMPELQGHLLRLISKDITRDQGLLLVLGGMNGEQRIATFLLSLSSRYQRLGCNSTHFSLRMTREEIGSYLGLSLETVSRLLCRLGRAGVIRLNNRDIELRNIAHLRELATYSG